MHEEMMDSCDMLIVRVGGNFGDWSSTDTADWRKSATARPACGLNHEVCAAAPPWSEHTSFESENKDSESWCKVGAACEMPELTCFDHSSRGDAALAMPVLALVGGGVARDGETTA